MFRSVVKERRKETEKKILGEMEEKNEILSGERLPARSEGVASVFRDKAAGGGWTSCRAA